LLITSAYNVPGKILVDGRIGSVDDTALAAICCYIVDYRLAIKMPRFLRNVQKLITFIFAAEKNAGDD